MVPGCVGLSRTATAAGRIASDPDAHTAFRFAHSLMRTCAKAGYAWKNTVCPDSTLMAGFRTHRIAPSFEGVFPAIIAPIGARRRGGTVAIIA